LLKSREKSTAYAEQESQIREEIQNHKLSARGRQSAIFFASVLVLVLPFDRPDFRFVFLQWIDVDHPVEDYGMELSAGGGTFGFGGDGSA
jgi:hypothetical protein